MTIPLEHVIGLSALLFTVGAIGALVRRNLVAILMSIELMLNASNLALVGFNRVHAQAGLTSALDGQVFALFVMSVAAAEIAVGLAMLIALVRNRDSMNVDDVSLLEW